MDGSGSQASEDTATSALPLRFSQPLAGHARPWRVWTLAWLAVGLLHVALLTLLLAHRPGATETTRSEAIVVEFITRVEPPSEVVDRPAAKAEALSLRKPAKSPGRAIPTAAATPAAATIDKPLRLFRPDGGLQLPGTLLADIDATHRSQQGFEFQIPGVIDAGKFMERPVALEYEATQFDAYWKPDESLLDELLRKAMEATTKEVRIPIPGHPGSKIVCHVWMLAAVGTCGVRNNADGYRVERDDPNTLDEEEAKQCQVWWERIVASESQDIWRKTRDLYERECRKPLLKRAALPE
ncbi:MAG TPA: hypothetical protein VFY12_02045 [Arenimonas sp.]|nr:hypothetical protein [Arenimonas sp.]